MRERERSRRDDIAKVTAFLGGGAGMAMGQTVVVAGGLTL